MTPTELQKHFAAQPGSGQIGSAFAAEGLAYWLRRLRPLRVVEVGSGIGFLTTVILRALREVQFGGLVSAVEPNAWCRERCIENVKRFGHRVPALYTDWRDVAHIDFLVIDGGDRRNDYYGNLTKRAGVFFEGGRREQRATLRTMYAGGRPFIEATWKPRWTRHKGYAVVLFDPTRVERLWIAAVRVREWVLDGIARARGRAIGKRRAG